MKSLLEYRPIFHKRDETNSRARVLLVPSAAVAQGTGRPPARKEWKLEWRRHPDLDNLIEMEVAINGKGYVFRARLRSAGKVFQAAAWPCHPRYAHAELISSSRRWRESVSLGRFQNCNPMKMDDFLHHGVEDEPNSASAAIAIFGASAAQRRSTSTEPRSPFPSPGPSAASAPRCPARRIFDRTVGTWRGSKAVGDQVLAALNTLRARLE